MRTRLILGIVAAVLLIPQAVWALCMVRPLDEVVRSSDAVLVGTVTNARPMGPHRSGIIVSLNVQQVLKGSTADGQKIVIRSCGPVVIGSMARTMAKNTIGTRGLFLLTVGKNGTSYQYSDITTPQNMTLDQKIVEARQVLGLPAVTFPGRPLVQTTGTSWWLWAVGVVVVVVALSVGVVFVVRRARHA